VGRLGLVSLCAAALAWPAAAGAFTRTEEIVTMRDGVTIATTLYLPDGTPPAAGWPAVMMLHGLNGRRQDFAPLAESVFAAHGYAVLLYDARGHAESGGVVTLDGPSEIEDVEELFQRLAARPDVDDRRIGGWGVSYGGGAIMRAAVQGLPFAALEPHITWSDLYSAILPQSFAKSGVVFGFTSGVQRPSELLTRIKDDALASRNLDELRRTAGERSSLPQLSGLRTPTFWLQGKRDFAFGMEQAIDAYRRLAGPKRLYLGNLGHPPSTFVSDDSSYFLEQDRLWFDRFLKGVPNGIDRRPPVELAPTPFVATRIGRYASLPATRALAASVFSVPRSRTIGPSAKLVRDLPLPPREGLLETFGSATVSVTASTASRWPHLVAVLSALPPAGEEIVVSSGGVRTASLGRRSQTLTIRLMSTSTPIPARSRLRVTLAATSLAQDPDNLVYLQSAPAGSTLTIRRVSLSVPVLRTPVSR
jgi:pimeloyl-ACP methyl ester carboxylesterase